MEKINRQIKLYSKNTNKFEMFCVVLTVCLPLKRETATLNALIPLALKDLGRQSRQKRLDGLFGAILDTSVVKKGETQILQIYAECLDKYEIVCAMFEEIGKLLYAPLERGAFEDVENSKELLRKCIFARENDKREFAKLRAFEEMSKNSMENFGVYADGYAEDLEKIDSETLYERYLEILAGCFDVVTVGNLKELEISELAKKYIAREDTYNVKKVIDKDGNLSQTRLCMLFRANKLSVNGKGFFCLLLFNEIFGGGPESHLFRIVREKENLCYYISATLYRYKSIILVQCGIEGKNIEITENLILEQLKCIKNGEFDDSEIEQAKKILIQNLEKSQDRQSSIADFVVSQILAEDERDIEGFIREINCVNKLDIVETVKSLYLDTVYLYTNEE